MDNLDLNNLNPILREKLEKPEAPTLMGSRVFLNIPASIAHDPELSKLTPAMLFGEIYSMLNVTGQFYMSNARLAELYHCDERSIRNALKKLEEKGYIVRQNIYKPGTKQIIGRQIIAGPATLDMMALQHDRYDAPYGKNPGVRKL